MQSIFHTNKKTSSEIWENELKSNKRRKRVNKQRFAVNCRLNGRVDIFLGIRKWKKRRHVFVLVGVHLCVQIVNMFAFYVAVTYTNHHLCLCGVKLWFLRLFGLNNFDSDCDADSYSILNKQHLNPVYCFRSKPCLW